MKTTARLSFSRRTFVGKMRAFAISASLAMVLASATPARAQAQQQAMGLAMALSAGPTTSTSSSTATAATAPTYEYEVASIKPAKPSSGGQFMMMMRYTDDGLTAGNMSLMLLLQSAYGVGKDRFSGAPDWLNSERYDIDAKMDGATAEQLKKLTPPELKVIRQKMLQALLADRFKLTVHLEEKELPVYNLVIGKNGPKLQETKPDDPNKAPDPAAPKGSGPGGPITFSNGGGSSKSVTASPAGGASVSFGGPGGVRSASGHGASMETILAALTNACGRPVVDKTGLTGKYDYKIQWTPEESQDADSTAPSIFTAVQEQLGLKLESAKGPVGIFVIDHIEKPSGN